MKKLNLGMITAIALLCVVLWPPKLIYTQNPFDSRKEPIVQSAGWTFLLSDPAANQKSALGMLGAGDMVHSGIDWLKLGGEIFIVCLVSGIVKFYQTRDEAINLRS